MYIHEILHAQKAFFHSGQTLNVNYRKLQLKRLKEVLENNEDAFYDAIYKDFGKSAFDTFTTELAFVLKDIDYYLKNLTLLARPKKVKTNLVNQIGSSKIINEPFGCALIIGAWNYPYQLSLLPVVAAMAAGNCCVLKPSELAENASRAMAKVINDTFPAELLFVVEGGVEETTALLKLKFDKIFFTGSTKIGKIVYEAAAKNLVPVTLELGGKSPAIVTRSANLEVAAKRIVWGKYLNAGQTCVAPDYVFVDEEIKEKFLLCLKDHILQFNYTRDAAHYTKIINHKNFERLQKLMVPDKIYYGGKTDETDLYIEPTIMDNVFWEDAVMQEEIFGPILPVLSFKNFKEAIVDLKEKDKPLAAYLFSGRGEEKTYFSEQLSFGGGCINDVVMQLSNDHLPFGGVGSSGIGNYHGKFGFETFSHQKAVLERVTWGEPDFKYPPYSKNKLKWIKRVM